MRLLIIMPSGVYRGGAEEALLQLCSQAGLRNVHIEVVLLSHGNLGAEIESRGVKVHVISIGRFRHLANLARAIAMVCRVARQSRSDVIMSWMVKAHMIGSVVGMLLRKPSLYYQMGISDGRGWDRLTGILPCQGAVACSNFVAEEERNRVRHPVMTAHLGANIKLFHEAAEKHTVADAKRKLGCDPQKPLIGIVARLQRWKGIHTFVRAVELVAHTHPNVQGVIVGGAHEFEPDYDHELRLLISSRGLENRVRMMGATRDVPACMNAMDIIIHTSNREPFGIVIAEAMALGKPVIGTIPGGPAEIIEDGISGLLVPFNREDLLATAVGRFLDDKNFAEECARKAKVRASTFSCEAFAQRFINVVETLIANKN